MCMASPKTPRTPPPPAAPPPQPLMAQPAGDSGPRADMKRAAGTSALTIRRKSPVSSTSDGLSGLQIGL